MKKILAVLAATLLTIVLIGGLCFGEALITVSVSPVRAMAGETVTVTGTAPSELWVTLKGISEDGSLVCFDAVQANAAGEYRMMLTIPDLKAGELVLIVGNGPMVARTSLTIYTPSGGDSNNGGDETKPGSDKKHLPSIINLEGQEITPQSGGPIDINDHWAETTIRSLLERGIVSGYPDGTIRPDAPITRAEAARILVLATGLSPTEGVIEQAFTDKGEIPGWARPYVKTVLNNYTMIGYEDKTFRAEANLTRSEMIAMLMRAFGKGESVGVLPFSDREAVGDWCNGYAMRAYELGVVNGYPVDNTLRPRQVVTRAEMLTMVLKAMEL